MPWEKSGFNIPIPSDVSKVVDVGANALKSVSFVLSTIKTIAQVVKIFITGFANPALVALGFVLDQVIDVVRSMRGSAVYMISISRLFHGTFIPYSDLWPHYSSGYFTDSYESLALAQEQERLLGRIRSVSGAIEDEWKNGKNKDVERYKGLIKAKKDYQLELRAVKNKISRLHSEVNPRSEEGMWLLSAQQAINAYLASFKDKKDINRPFYDITSNTETSDTTGYAGGLVMMVGFTMNIDEFGRRYTNIVRLLAKFLNSADYYNQYKSMQRVYEKITNPGADDITATEKKLQGKEPNWAKYGVFTEIMPEMGDMLAKVEQFMVGMKSGLKSTSEGFDSMLDFIDTKSRQITEIVTAIESFTQWYDDIAELSLESGNMYTLYIPPQRGGLKLLKDTVRNASAVNSPLGNQEIRHCEFFSIIGSGAGFGMIASLLGYGDFLENLGVDDNVPLDTDKMKEDFGIASDYFDDLT